MKLKFVVLLFSFFIILESCSEDVDKSPQEENFYMEFMLDDSTYFVSDKEHQVELGDIHMLCNYKNEYVVGHQNFSLWDPKYESYIHRVGFSLKKKVFKDELILSDESSYIKHVLYAESYGFPTNPSGYFSVYDLEKDIFVVPRDVSAEGYLWIATNQKEVYQSFSIVPNERDKSSYLIIDKVIENKQSNNSAYDYIVEGRFRVNLFDRVAGTDAKIVEGNFRWPIKEIHNSDLLLLCK